MRRILEFLRRGLWDQDLRDLALLPRIGLTALRIVCYIAIQWNQRLIGLRAAGLSLLTLLAMVPLLALAFGFAKGLGYGEDLDRIIVENTADLPAHLREIADKLRLLVERTSFKAMGWISSVVLIYSGLALFSRVEQALNDVWDAHVRRPWLRRASDFISLVVVVPVLSLVAMVSSSALHTAEWIVSLRESGGVVAWVYEAGLGFVSHVLLWLAFTALYRFMPSARVKWLPALAGGVIAGSSLLFMQGVYIDFQVGVARMNAIYATLAALPLLLIYLQVAWVIVLLGAYVSYSLQNLQLIGPGRRPEELPFALRERIALKLTERVCHRFLSGGGAQDLGELAGELNVPRAWLDSIAADLVGAGVFAQVEEEQLIPALPCAKISVDLVTATVRGECPPDLAARLELPADIDRDIDSAALEERRARERISFDSGAGPSPE